MRDSDDLQNLKQVFVEARWKEGLDGRFANPFGEVQVDFSKWHAGYVVVLTPTQTEAWPRHIAGLIVRVFDHKWRN
jgi:hypothetical protein